MQLQTKFKVVSIKPVFRQARAVFFNAAIVKIQKKKKKYVGPIAACFKHGNSSTPKNVAVVQENTALDAFYGCMFKTRPLLFL